MHRQGESGKERKRAWERERKKKKQLQLKRLRGGEDGMRKSLSHTVLQHRGRVGESKE